MIKLLEIEEVLKKIPQNEKILFKSSKYTNKNRQILIICSHFIISWIGFALLILALFNFNVKGFLDIFNILTFAISTGFLAIIMTISFYYIFNIKLEQYLILTDKKIYIYTIERKSNKFNSFELSSLKAIGFKTSWYGKKTNLGIINLIFDYRNKAHSIKFVSEVFKTQKIIESLLYEYSGLEQKILIMENTKKYPILYTISYTKFKTTKKRLHLIYLGFGITFFSAIVIGLIIRFFTNMYFLFVYTILLLCLAFGFFIVYSKGTLYLSKNCSSIGEVLKLENDKIILSKNGKAKKIVFGDKTVLNILDICIIPHKLNKDIFGIKIKENYNSKKKIIFGPVDNFEDLYESIYYSLINWKKKNSFLLSKDQFQESVK